MPKNALRCNRPMAGPGILTCAAKKYRQSFSFSIVFVGSGIAPSHGGVIFFIPFQLFRAGFLNYIIFAVPLKAAGLKKTTMSKGPVSQFIEHHYRHFNAA